MDSSVSSKGNIEKNEKIYNCFYCSRVLKTSWAFRCHIRAHHDVAKLQKYENLQGRLNRPVNNPDTNLDILVKGLSNKLVNVPVHIPLASKGQTLSSRSISLYDNDKTFAYEGASKRNQGEVAGMTIQKKNKMLNPTINHEATKPQKKELLLFKDPEKYCFKLDFATKAEAKQEANLDLSLHLKF